LSTFPDSHDQRGQFYYRITNFNNELLLIIANESQIFRSSHVSALLIGLGEDQPGRKAAQFQSCNSYTNINSTNNNPGAKKKMKKISAHISRQEIYVKIFELHRNMVLMR
jgi:hypothetical protein